MKKHIFIAAIAVLTLSCNTGNQRTENQQETVVQENENGIKPNQLADYTYKNYSIESSKVLDGDDKTYFRADYPEFSHSKINDYVQKHVVLNEEEESLESVGKKFITDYDQFYDEVEFKRPWFEERMDSVKVQTPNYIGFVSHFSNYTGGAHGNYGTFYNNYNVLKNTDYTLQDFINDRSALLKVAEEKFRQDEQISVTHSLTDEYFFEEGKFSLPDNFILQKDGILFHYNIYEIKPYASGHTELIVPYKSIETLLSPIAKEIIAEIK